MNEMWDKTGIYIAWPTTAKLKPIYRGSPTKRPSSTMVNDQCTNVGKTAKSFQARQGDYVGTFGGEVEFKPLAAIEGRDELAQIEEEILLAMRKEFRQVGRARQWFHTSDRGRVEEIVRDVLAGSGVEHEWLCSC